MAVQWMAFAFFGLVAAAGVAVFLHGIRLAVQARAALRWPVVRGRIVDSGIRDYETQGADGIEKMYAPRIRYSCIVPGGGKREFDRITFGFLNSGSREKIQRLISRYPTGAEVDVWLHPENSAEAILEPGVSGAIYAQLAIGLLLAGWFTLAIVLWPHFVEWGFSAE